MKRSITAVDLKNIYLGKGEYSVKFLLDSTLSQNTHTVEVNMFDCLGKPMTCQSKRWGTKINISFSVSEEIPDGAAIVDIRTFGKQQQERERFKVWIVK